MDKTKILMTYGSLMKVKSIAEFRNTFDLHHAIIGLEKQFSVFLRVAVLSYRVYCTELLSGTGCFLIISSTAMLCVQKKKTCSRN